MRVADDGTGLYVAEAGLPSEAGKRLAIIKNEVTGGIESKP